MVFGDCVPVSGVQFLQHSLWGGPKKRRPLWSNYSKLQPNSKEMITLTQSFSRSDRQFVVWAQILKIAFSRSRLIQALTLEILDNFNLFTRRLGLLYLLNSGSNIASEQKSNHWSWYYRNMEHWQQQLKFKDRPLNNCLNCSHETRCARSRD